MPHDCPLYRAARPYSRSITVPRCVSSDRRKPGSGNEDRSDKVGKRFCLRFVTVSCILAMIRSLYGKCKLTPPMALRPAEFFGSSERFWINLQANIEIQTHKPEMEAELAKIKPVE